MIRYYSFLRQQSQRNYEHLRDCHVVNLHSAKLTYPRYIFEDTPFQDPKLSDTDIDSTSKVRESVMLFLLIVGN
jgi:hypothetical protein